jgi:hypothetical protein
VRHRAPAPQIVAQLLRQTGISSVQVTFDPEKPPAEHAMPPGGFRLAVVNCWDLEAGRAARDSLREAFSWLPLR